MKSESSRKGTQLLWAKYRVGWAKKISSLARFAATNTGWVPPVFEIVQGLAFTICFVVGLDKQRACQDVGQRCSNFIGMPLRAEGPWSNWISQDATASDVFLYFVFRTIVAVIVNTRFLDSDSLGSLQSGLFGRACWWCPCPALPDNEDTPSDSICQALGIESVEETRRTPTTCQEGIKSLIRPGTLRA